MNTFSITLLRLLNLFFGISLVHAQLVTLYQVYPGTPPTSTSTTTQTGPSVTTFVSAIGTGADGYTTYVVHEVTVTTSAPSATPTTALIPPALGNSAVTVVPNTSIPPGYNLGGINASVPDVVTFAAAASGFKSAYYISSDGFAYSESVGCTYNSDGSAVCIDALGHADSTTTVADTITYSGTLIPEFTVTALLASPSSTVVAGSNSTKTQSNGAFRGSGLSVAVSAVVIPCVALFLCI
jgi:hypothetical protein